MFFSSTTIEALTEDHNKIRKELEVLKDTDHSLKKRINAFERLVPVLVSHSAREEKIIYAFMKSRSETGLKAMALEGEEEHKIVERLVKEMFDGRSKADVWTAKAKVLVELIEHHVNEEENEIFPALKKLLDKNSDKVLRKKYEKIGPVSNTNFSVSIVA
jgi:hemerythrin-like domain-containing protein